MTEKNTEAQEHATPELPAPPGFDGPEEQTSVEDAGPELELPAPATIHHQEAPEPPVADVIESVEAAVAAEPTQVLPEAHQPTRLLPVQSEPTQVLPSAPPARLTDEDLYRTGVPAGSPATPMEVGAAGAAAAAVSAEEARLAAERAARKEAREQALAAAAPTATTPVVPPKPPKRVTDKFFGSLGLFLLRVVVAAIMGIHGLEKVMNIPVAQEMFRKTLIPEPNIIAIVTGVAELGIAVALVFGLMVRLAGFGTAAIAIGSLVFVHWGPWSPFVAGRSGFLGELELLLGAVGLLLLFLGGGGWGIDHGFRISRARDKDRRIEEGL